MEILFLVIIKQQVAGLLAEVHRILKGFFSGCTVHPLFCSFFLFQCIICFFPQCIRCRLQDGFCVLVDAVGDHSCCSVQCFGTRTQKKRRCIEPVFVQQDLPRPGITEFVSAEHQLLRTQQSAGFLVPVSCVADRQHVICFAPDKVRREPQRKNAFCGFTAGEEILLPERVSALLQQLGRAVVVFC